MVLALLCLANMKYTGNLVILCTIYVCKGVCAICVAIAVSIYVHYLSALDKNMLMYTYIYIYTHLLYTELHQNNGI